MASAGDSDVAGVPAQPPTSALPALDQGTGLAAGSEAGDAGGVWGGEAERGAFTTDSSMRMLASALYEAASGDEDEEGAVGEGEGWDEGVGETLWTQQQLAADTEHTAPPPPPAPSDVAAAPLTAPLPVALLLPPSAEAPALGSFCRCARLSPLHLAPPPWPSTSSRSRSLVLHTTRFDVPQTRVHVEIRSEPEVSILTRQCDFYMERRSVYNSCNPISIWSTCNTMSI